MLRAVSNIPRKQLPSSCCMTRYLPSRFSHGTATYTHGLLATQLQAKEQNATMALSRW